MAGAASPFPTSVLWNLPDWRDETAYAYIDALTPAHARWECLRRFGAYRTKWTLFGATVGGFGLPTLLDPRLRGDDLPSTFSFIEERWRGTVIDNRWDATAEHLDLLFENGVVLVRVDLYRPIGPQLDTAGGALAKLREVEIRQEPLEREPTETGSNTLLRKVGPDFPDRVVERARARPKLISHLRAADAIAEGSVWREVAEEVWGLRDDSDGVSDAQKRHSDFFDGLGRL